MITIGVHDVTSITVQKTELRDRDDNGRDMDAYTMTIEYNGTTQTIGIYCDAARDIGLGPMVAPTIGWTTTGVSMIDGSGKRTDFVPVVTEDLPSMDGEETMPVQGDR